MLQDEIIELDEGEYQFLSEKFDIMSVQDVSELPKYVVSCRKSNFRKLVDIAIVTELDKTAQKYITDKFFNSLSVTQISQKYSVSRQAVYRVLDRAEKRLYEVLKYAYYCGFSLLNPPKNFGEIIIESNKEESI